jgi:hypothetical protein
MRRETNVRRFAITQISRRLRHRINPRSSICICEILRAAVAARYLGGRSYPRDERG